MTFRLNGTLGNIVQRQNKFVESVELTRWAVNWCRRRVERANTPEDAAEWEFETARYTADLAFVLGLAGDPEEGAALARQAADLCLKRLETDSSRTRIALYVAGLNHQWMEHLEEAEEYFKKLE